MPSRSNDISLVEARKLILLCQGIHRQGKLGQGKPAALKAIENLGYVQIDTISVVERAHHHTLWNRANAYQPQHLSQLLADKTVFEYWSHAAAYLPMRDFRYSLPRKLAIKSGERHWHNKNHQIAQAVLERIQSDGPLQAKDFEHVKNKKHNGWWDWKPTKIALEQLFMEGDLMVSERRGFQKVYDLTERVLPSTVDTRVPSTEEFHRHLIYQYLAANGLGTTSNIAYLRKGAKKPLLEVCRNMLENSELQEVSVRGESYYALPDAVAQLSAPLSRSKVAILSPFDNLLIQRKRMVELFDFDYQIECYVPAAKRQYGYFCLPLLWGQTFAGRMDAKIDRKNKTLHVLSLHVETRRKGEFLEALQPVLQNFAIFNGADKIVQKPTSWPT